MRVAIVCSAHGYGHVTRELVVADELAARGAEVTFFTAAPAHLTGARRVVPWTVDVGLVQHDSLSEDIAATVARLDAVVTDAAIDRLAGELRAFDRVIVDIAPPALEAARRAGVPAFAVGNFDWAWIYQHYPALRGWTDRFRAWQAPHPALALAPGPGLSGFASVERFGVVGRRAGAPGPRSSVGRGALRGAGPPPQERGSDRRVLVCFGGFGLPDLGSWLPRMEGVTWVVAPPLDPLDRPDVCWEPDAAFLDLVASSDVLLTKPGYGMYAEAALAGKRIVWVERGTFPEAPALEAAMWARGDEKVRGRGGATGAELAAGPVAEAVAEAVARCLGKGRPDPLVSDAGARVAERVLGNVRGPA